ncbi:MAG: RDD family protein [Lysinibacillus sp.]
MQVVGFWKRFVAHFIDIFIISIIGTILMLPFIAIGVSSQSEVVSNLLPILYILAVIAIVLAYMIVLESSNMQGTFGKKALGMVVVDENGERITIKKSIVRTGSKIGLSWFFYIGYIMVAFTERKQGLHDMIAKTYCVAKEGYKV